MEWNVDGRGILKNLYGIEIGDDSDALKDAEGNVKTVDQLIAEYHQKKISDLTETYKGEKDSQFKRGTRETSERWEKDLRTKWGIDDVTIKGNALLDAIEERQKSELDKLKSTLAEEGLTEDKIKSSPLYQELLLHKDQEIESVKSEWQKKLDDKDHEIKQRAVIKKKIDFIGSFLADENLAFTADKEIDTTRKNNFVNDMMGRNWKIDESGEPVMLDEDGGLLRDKMQNVVKFDDVVKKGLRNHIGFKENRIPTPGTPTPTPSNEWKGKVPATEEEFLKMMEDPKNREHKRAIAKAYKESKFS